MLHYRIWVSEKLCSPIISRPGIYCVLTSQDNLPTEEEYSRGPGEDSEEEARHLGPRILYDNSAESEQDNSDLDNISEPEEVKRAWEELVIIQREQQR